MKSRAAGLVLHPTSLPGPAPIGDLGPSVDRFLDWAALAGQSIWQVLPLGPTGSGHSPYSGLSTRAGNPLLIHVPEPPGAAPEEPRESGAPARARVDYAAASSRQESLL